MIENGKKVTMHYTVRANGEVVDDSHGNKPLEFVFGTTKLIPGLIREIEGLNPGDSRQFTVACEDAYGPIDERLILEIPRAKMPEGEIEIGQVFSTTIETGEVLRGLVKDVREETVVLDFNHPCAGKNLDFEIEIIEVS